WMNLQTQHDLSKAAIAARDDLAAIQTLRVA
ncbi:MAG: addiction module antidote protein, HigA family, partial [Brevundimonas sp.]|nr:addiction module antidote protein, HigA family [Brevundimonas sp.]